MNDGKILNEQLLTSLKTLIKISERILFKSQKLIEINSNKDKKTPNIGFVKTLRIVNS